VPRCPHARHAQRHEHVAAGADLDDGLPDRHSSRVLCRYAENRVLVVRVGGPEVPVAIDREAVRVREQPHANAPHERSAWREFEQWRIGVAPVQARGVAARLVVEAAMEHPDVAV